MQVNHLTTLFDIINIQSQENILENRTKPIVDVNFLVDFLMTIENNTQSDLLLKLFSGYSGDMFLVDYFQEQSTIELIGTSKNKESREKYIIHMNNGSFNCNCKDYTYRCVNIGIVCKHISFLICKVGKIYDYRFFETLKLTNDNILLLNTQLANKSLWKNNALSIKYINHEFIHNNKEISLNDTCAICHELLSDKSKCISCPDCYNYVHKKCVKIWIEEDKSCIFCRSDCWKNYISEF